MLNYSFSIRYKTVRAGIKWIKNVGNKYSINPLTLIGNLCKIIHRRK